MKTNPHLEKLIEWGYGQPKPSYWVDLPLERRLALQITIDENGCWLWNGAICPNGYGHVHRDKKPVGAHVASYELFVGPIPEGTEPDHTCRKRACINPEHLEPVTHSVNVIRGDSPSARQRRLGVCVKGHPMTPENRDEKKRRCKVCNREYSRAYAQRPGVAETRKEYGKRWRAARKASSRPSNSVF